MGSLKAFKLLEDVTTDLRLLIGHPRDTIRTLSEMLPSSIRRVNFFADEDFGNKTLQRLADAMDMVDTPELESINFIRPSGRKFSVWMRDREECPEDWSGNNSQAALSRLCSARGCGHGSAESGP